MFLDNLSASMLQLCELNKLSYERASERCNISSRQFGNIARGRCEPTLSTLEGICTGFQVTPNELLIAEASFRTPMLVTEIHYVQCLQGLSGFYICPRCGTPLERDYQAYCDRCGQCLDWSKADRVTVYLPER